MTRKIYTAQIGINYVIYIKVNGKSKMIEFDRGFIIGTNKYKPTYSTTDKDIQKALEEDKAFNKEFVLTKIELVKEEESETKSEETPVKKTRKTKEE